MDDPIDPLAQMRDDPQLSVFVEPDFNPVAFARDVVRRDAATADDGDGDDDDLGAAMGRESHSEEMMRLIGQRLRSVDAAIRALVVEHQDDLLAQAGQTRELQGSVEALASRVEALKEEAVALRSTIKVPLDDIRRHAREMAAIQTTSALLRRVVRVALGVRKLQSALSNRHVNELESRDLSRVAHTLSDVELVLRGEDSEAGVAGMPVDLAGVHVVDEQRRWVAELGTQVRHRAHEFLLSAIESLSQTELGGALQVFFHLRCLPERVTAAIDHMVRQVSRAAVVAMDVTAVAADASGDGAAGAGDKGKRRTLPGGVRGTLTPAPGAAGAWRTALWARIDTLFERLYRTAVQAWNFQRVLAKKRDPFSHARLIDVLLPKDGEAMEKGQHQVYMRFWQGITAELRDQFRRAADGSKFLRNCLVDEYPRLRGQLLGMMERLQRSTEGRSGSAASSSSRGVVESDDFALPGGVGQSAAEQDRLLWSASGLMQVFLARSLARLNEPVGMMFPPAPAGSSGAQDDADMEVLAELPSSSDVTVLVKTMGSELRQCKADAGLSTAVARGIVAACKTFCAKAEVSSASSANATRIAADWEPTRAQSHNMSLLSRIDQLVTGLVAVQEQIRRGGGMGVPRTAAATTVGASAARILDDGLTALEALANLLLLPYGGAISASLVNIVQRMHRQSFSGSGSDVAYRRTLDTASPFMEALEKACAKVATSLLGPLPKHERVSRMRAAIVRHVVAAFNLHVTLIRPLSNEGKMALTRDMAHLELSLAPIAPPVAAGDAHAELRALRALLFAETADAVGDAALAESVRPSLIMHLLASRGPPEMRLPHAREGWSPDKYVRWTFHSADIAVAAAGEQLAERVALFPSREEELRREEIIWVRVRNCLDEYAQRMSTSGSELDEVYKCLDEHAPRLLEAYGKRIRGATTR